MPAFDPHRTQLKAKCIGCTFQKHPLLSLPGAARLFPGIPHLENVPRDCATQLFWLAPSVQPVAPCRATTFDRRKGREHPLCPSPIPPTLAVSLWLLMGMSLIPTWEGMFFSRREGLQCPGRQHSLRGRQLCPPAAASDPLGRAWGSSPLQDRNPSLCRGQRVPGAQDSGLLSSGAQV